MQAPRFFCDLSGALLIRPMKPIGTIRRENLELLVREAKTLEVLATEVGSTPIYLSQIRNQAVDSKTGRPREMGTSMARRLEIARGKLEGWMDQDHTTESPQPDASNVYEITPRRRVPIVSWVAAGNLEDIVDNHHPGEADEWVDVYDTLPSESAFALRVKNDSMTSPHPGERSFPEGTVIVVDPLRGSNAGDFVIAKDVVGQKATFKKLITDGGRWFLKPLNPAYPTVEIDDPALRVIGRVIEAVTRQKL